MQFSELCVQGAFLIDLEKREDERGFFSRMFCQKDFLKQGLETRFVQVNNSMSQEKGTLRGLHYQLPPKEEVKIIRCIQGEIFDVVLDLRKDSPTFGKWHGETLTDQNRKMLYVPKGCAHGFLTLSQKTEVIYLVSEFYSPELERGVLWCDPTFQIAWPETPLVLSERDKTHPVYV